MKAILPILICSAISAGLGYYFGHITLPAGSTATNQATPKPTAVAVAPQPVAPAPEPIAPEPAMEEAALPEPEEVETAEAPAPQPAPASESEMAKRAEMTMQTLTDSQGRTMHARILEVTDSAVKIRRNDGLETTIPLNMLSAADVAFCEYLRENQKEEEEEAPAESTDGFDWDAYFNS